MTKEITLKDRLIMSELTDINNTNEVVNVGCGGGRLDYHLGKMGYNVISTDYQDHAGWVKDFFLKEMEDWSDILNYHGNCNIFDLTTFPIQSSDVVVCSEVLEHIVDYKTAFKNLLKLTKNKLIITIPRERSFNVPGPAPRGHCNYWSDIGLGSYTDIKEFINMAGPYNTKIQIGMTKKKDYGNGQRVYMITVDKNNNNKSEDKIYNISDEQMKWEV